MSSDEEEDQELMDITEVRDHILNKSRRDRMQVSGWEDDDDGVENERNARDPDEKAILHAAETGDLKKVQKLVTKNRLLLESTDEDGYTPLHRACYGNYVEIVEYLVQAGAKIDSKTEDNWQPLHSALCWNNVECAAILIANGADINATSKGNHTPLHLVSATSYNQRALQLLLLHPDTDTRLVNSSGDTAEDIAKRKGKYYPMFEIVEDCLNVI